MLCLPRITDPRHAVAAPYAPGVRQQLLAFLAVRVGEHHMLHGFGHPAILALVEVRFCLLHDRRRAAPCTRCISSPLLRRELVERRWVGVVEAHLTLIDRAGVVLHGALETADAVGAHRRRDVDSGPQRGTRDRSWARVFDLHRCDRVRAVLQIGFPLRIWPIPRLMTL